MEIKTKYYDEVCVLAIHGKMMGGSESNKLYDEVKSNLEDGTLKFIIDMKYVKWLNSGGIGVLMNVFTTVYNAHGNICLADLSEEARSLLTVTKLIQIFKVSESVAAALENFKSSPPE